MICGRKLAIVSVSFTADAKRRDGNQYVGPPYSRANIYAARMSRGHIRSSSSELIGRTWFKNGPAPDDRIDQESIAERAYTDGVVIPRRITHCSTVHCRTATAF